MKSMIRYWFVAATVAALAACGGGDDTSSAGDDTSGGGVTTPAESVAGFSQTGSLNYLVYEFDNAGTTVVTSTATAQVVASSPNGTVTFGEDYATTADDWENVTWSANLSGKLAVDGNVVFLCPNAGQGVAAVSDNLTSVTNGAELSGKSFQTFKCSGGVIVDFEQVSFDLSGDAYVGDETTPIPSSEVQTAISGGDSEVKLNVYKTAGGKYFVIAAGKVGTPPNLTLWVEQPPN